MSRATGSPLARNGGQAVFIIVVAVEVALLALLTLAMGVGEALSDRTAVQNALLLASHAAVRAIVVPVGPQGIKLNESSAQSIFARILSLNIPAPLGKSLTSRMTVAQAGETDPHTGFTFGSAGVMASVSFRDTILGQSLAETLYVDTEVHTGVDWPSPSGRFPVGLVPGARRSDGPLSRLGAGPSSRPRHHLPGVDRTSVILCYSRRPQGHLHG